MSEIQLLASSYMAIIYVATVVVNLVSNEENAILIDSLRLRKSESLT